MDCPRCLGNLLPATIECPRCGFGMGMAVSMLGAGMVHLGRLVDAAHCLRLREVRQIDALLDDFQRRFPQVFLTLYVGVLPGHITIRELSFWLLNRAAFDTPDRRLNEYAISLVIDPASKSAGLTVGYALERVLDDQRLHGILKALRTSLWHGEYAAAIRRCVSLLDTRLRQTGQRLLRTDDVLPPQNSEEFHDDAGWRWLREHPPSEPRADSVEPLLLPGDEESEQKN